MRAQRFLTLTVIAPLAFAGAPVQEPAPSQREVVEEVDEEQGPQVSGATAELLRCLPGDSVLVLSAHDLDGVRAAAEGNAWFRFLQDEQVRPIFDSLLSEITDEMEAAGGEDAPDIDPIAVMESIHGSVLAFLVPVGEDLEPGVGLIVDPGEDRAAFTEYFEQLLDAIEKDAVASIDAYEDVELSVFEAREEGIDEEPIDTVMSFEVDGLFALVASRGVQNTLGLAQGLVDRRRQSEESLGMNENPWLSGARNAAGASQPFELFLDLGRVLDMTFEKQEMDEGERKVVDMLGLFDTRWIFANAGLGEGEALDFGLHVHMPETGALHGFLDLLGPLPLGMGRLMPTDSSSVGLFNFDVWGLYRGVMDLMEDHYPDEYPQMREQIDGMAQATGLDFEHDLLAQLSGEFGSFSMEVPEEESMMDMAGVFFGGSTSLDTSMGGATIIGLKNSGIVAEFLDQVLAMAGLQEMTETEDFQGRMVQHLSGPGGQFGVWWSFLEDSLVFSFYPTAVRSALRNAGSEEAPSMLDNERFSAALQPLTRAPMVSLTDTRTYLRTLLGFGDLIEQMASESGEESLAGLSAPEASLAEEYFSGTMLFAVERGRDSVGFRFSTF